MTEKSSDKHYSGPVAQFYDERRARTPRYAAEEAAFADLFDIAAPRSVLDCPFGTGRWMPFYKDIEGPVVGIDISADMLAQARAKFESPPASLSLVAGSIFDLSLENYSEQGIDLVVCTRFLNWLDPVRAATALSRLQAVDSAFAIVGASVRPAHSSLPRRSLMRWRLSIDNAKHVLRGKRKHFVHDEDWLVGQFTGIGWSIRARRFIFASPTRENFFYLLASDYHAPR